eukprot:14173944-Ditylum_brightwellii.AAC.2
MDDYIYTGVAGTATADTTASAASTTATAATTDSATCNAATTVTTVMVEMSWWVMLCLGSA